MAPIEWLYSIVAEAAAVAINAQDVRLDSTAPLVL
jgi:hypothetical protein